MGDGLMQLNIEVKLNESQVTAILTEYVTKLIATHEVFNVKFIVGQQYDFRGDPIGTGLERVEVSMCPKD